LADHGAHTPLYFSREDLLCKVFEAGLEPCELHRWTTTAATLAALVGVAPAFLCAVGVMGVAVA
jgi:hypothetical protein